MMSIHNGDLMEKLERIAKALEAVMDGKDKQIADLTAENKRLREALERIARCKHNPDPFGYLPAIAAEALTNQQPTHAPDRATKRHQYLWQTKTEEQP
jgi:hypothetical protein